MSPLSPIPSRYFDSGVEYSFYVTACNVFHLCASAYHTVSTLNSSSPTVSILGASVRAIFPYQSISLSADMHILRGCDQLPSRSNLSITWSVKRNNLDIKLSGNSSIQSSSSFYIAPYQLRPLNTYYVYATVTDLVTTISTFTYVKLVVKKGSIRAIIAGSSFTTLTVGNSLILDASSSYDENSNQLSLLKYSWRCLQILPVFSSSCNSVSNRFLNASVITIVAKPAVSSTIVFTVTVSNRNKEYYSSSSVTIQTVIGSDWAADAAITTKRQPVVLNPGDKLKLIAAVTVTVYGKYIPNTTAWWTMEGNTNNSSLNDLSLTPLIVTGSGFAPAAAPTKFTFPANIVLRENSLFGPAVLTFTLQTLRSKSSIVVYVNSNPRPGLFTVIPDRGVELSTLFSFSVIFWQDNDLPLSFTFGYLTVFDEYIEMQPRSELAYMESIVPCVSHQQPLQSLYAQVFDSMDANTTALAITNVVPQSNLAVADLRNLLDENILLLEGNSIAQQHWIGAIGSVLNTVDCSLVSNCFQRYGRQDCLRTSGQCGPCFNSSYSGPPGDGNTFCHPLSSISTTKSRKLSSLSPGNCVSSRDCIAPYESCVFGHCTIADQTCGVGECSSKGACIYLNKYSLITVSSCKVNDVYCSAVCSCYAGYFGDHCQFNSAEWGQRIHLRAKLLEYFIAQIPSRQGDANTLSYLISSTLQLSGRGVYSEMDIQATNAVLYALSIILQLADSLHTPYSELTGFIGVVNSLVKICENSTETSPNSAVYILGPTNSSLMYEYCTELGLQVDQLLQAYFAVVVSDIVPGERDEVSCLESDIRTSIKVVLLSAYSNRISNSLEFPETEAEQLSGKQPISYSFINVPYFGLGNVVYLAGVSRSISSVNWNQQLISANDQRYYYVSNPLTIFVFNQSRQLTSSLLWNNVLVTLQNNQKLHYVDPYETVTATQCYDKDYFHTNYTCRTKTNSSISEYCPGCHSNHMNRILLNY